MLPELAGASATALGCMAYVYRYRGTARYSSVREYVRKAWPIFAPLNCLLYLFTEKRAQHVYMDLAQFPELKAIQSEWTVIRDEALALQAAGYFNKTKDPNTPAYFDVGFRTFFKYGWSRFYLNWYGHTHESALALCPKTVALLARVPSVNGAMFSLLPPGGQLTRHIDPLAISLRYHLGLATPNSDDCFINVDGQGYSWRDGQAALFDITYLHFARNDSASPRLILMCDIERPLGFIGTAINFFYKGIARLTVVPNLQGDTQGLANRVFSTVGPLLARTKGLKKSNRKLYTLIKWAFNSALLMLLALPVYGLVQLIGRTTT